MEGSAENRSSLTEPKPAKAALDASISEGSDVHVTVPTASLPAMVVAPANDSQSSSSSVSAASAAVPDANSSSLPTKSVPTKSASSTGNEEGKTNVPSSPGGSSQSSDEGAAKKEGRSKLRKGKWTVRLLD